MRILFVMVIVVGLVAVGLAKPTHSDQGWSAMTYNVKFDSKSQSETLSLIEAREVDVLCLQEITHQFVAKFNKKLGDVYPYTLFEPRSGTWGVGIASRYPLTKPVIFVQKPYRMPAAEAIIHVKKRSVQISCVHLFPPVAKRNKKHSHLKSMNENAKLREAQAGYLVERYRATKNLVLLLGDFNEGPNDLAMEIFKKHGFSSACQTKDARCAGTFPANKYLLPAVFQVDHILGKGLKFRDTKRHKGGSSDHYPVSTIVVSLPSDA